MTEDATEKVWVNASKELLLQMEKGWSRPVIVRAVNKLPDGSWELIFRNIDFVDWSEVIG